MEVTLVGFTATSGVEGSDTGEGDTQEGDPELEWQLVGSRSAAWKLTVRGHVMIVIAHSPA